MNKIKITTLSPVHIGSGNLLQNNMNFLVVKDGEDSYIHITDDRKILELIGADHVDHWIASIEKGESTRKLVETYAPASSVSDYAKRRITCYSSGIKLTDTLKEQIHNGFGIPYIPGSSIKGAIRTAILSVLSDHVRNKELKVFVQGKVKAKLIENQLFGRDPNSDLFRFIQVGDAYFEKDSTIATRMVNLNIRKKNDLYDGSKPQLIEAIGVGETATFQMDVKKDFHDFARRNFPDLKPLPGEMQSLQSLFKSINNHTSRLIEKEIAFWNEMNLSGSEAYLDVMADMLGETKSCEDELSCILRIGHGSGWRFITGAWTESLENFNEVINAARPNNQKYSEYPFPKSRRIDEDSDVLGFVKLSLLNDERTESR